jgi:glutathione synthase
MDPPMNDHYVNALMILREWKHCGIRISNDVDGILGHQEKLTAYRQYPHALPSFVGGVGAGLADFVHMQLASGVTEFIVKPLNAYSGIGVAKLPGAEIIEKLKTPNAFEYSYLVCQPFWKGIHQGEFRSVFWKQKYLGSIIKRPKSGEYMANIAQGATFAAAEISPAVKKICEKINRELAADGIDLVAYDIMEDKISEVNVTCPGLLVELSHAHQKNFINDFD